MDNCMIAALCKSVSHGGPVRAVELRESLKLPAPLRFEERHLRTKPGGSLLTQSSFFKISNEKERAPNQASIGIL
jgi:hypothetical protein